MTVMKGTLILSGDDKQFRKNTHGEPGRENKEEERELGGEGRESPVPTKSSKSPPCNSGCSPRKYQIILDYAK